MSTRIAIVGGGLAGSSLGKLLTEHHIDFHWYAEDKTSASHISSGILNPVTGRRYALAWRYDDLIACAQEFYGDFLIPIQLEKHFAPYKDENTIDTIVAGKEKYLSKLNEHWIAVKQSYQLQTKAFIKHMSAIASEEQRLYKESFQHCQLTYDNGFWSYKNQLYSHIIFAEGIGVKSNPFFNYLPFQPNRGEALVIDIKESKPSSVKKHGKFICPFDAFFWIGSSFDKVGINAPLHTEKMKNELMSSIPDLIETQHYEIVEHLGALRSTTPDRRPIIGEHPQHQGLYIFNGFGTKGASLIPWCAKQILSFLLNQQDLDKEIDIIRVKLDS